MNERYLINDICDVGSSKRIYLSEYQDSGIPFYRGKEIIEKDSNKEISNELFISHDRYNEIKEKFGVPEKGDILMTAVGTIGISWYVNEENFYFKDGNLIWFKNFKKNIVNSKYLYYIFKSKLFSEIIKNISIGSTQKAITIEQVKKIELEFPKIEIQDKIVKILDNINNKIIINNEINSNLHELCNILYTDLTKQLDDTNSSVKNIKNVAKCVLGGTPSRAKGEYWNGSINWINSGEINKFRIIKATEKITELGLKKSSTTLLPKGTTVLAITGATLGQVSRLEIDSCANQSVIGIMTNERELNNYMYLSILNNINNLISKQTGGAQQHINKNDVETHEILVPNKELISRFDETVNPLFEQISINCFENQRLKQLRDTLLPKLMNGEIDLDNIGV